MSKAIKALGGKTASAYSIDPLAPKIAGYDFEAPEGSNLIEVDKARLKPDSKMSKNIAVRGVIKPIVCRMVKIDGEDVLAVIDGRRRTINARAANEMRAEAGEDPIVIRFVLEAGGDNADALATMVSANSFTMGHGPMAQAEKCAQLRNAGYDDAQIANFLGFGKSTVGNRLKLLDLPKSVQTLVRKGANDGGISVMAALELVGEENAAELAEELAKEGGGKQGQASRAKKKKAGEDADHKAPTKGLLSKVIEHEDFMNLTEPVRRAIVFGLGPKKVMESSFFEVLTEQEQRAIRWMAGDLKTPGTIDGLSDVIKAATAKKVPPRVDEVE